MARLLVKAVDHTHPDPKIDAQGAYKRGDVVCVMSDDHVWGGAEGLPKFEQIDLPGVPVESLQHMIGSEVERLDEIAGLAARKNPRLRRFISNQKFRDTKRRRRYTIDLTDKTMTDKTRL